jgi:hypothetical protein
MARSHAPAVDREQQFEIMTGETELARHDEQLDRQEEKQDREHGAAHKGRDRGDIVQAPSRRRSAPVAPAHHDVSPQVRAEFGVADPPLPAGLLHPELDEVKRVKLHPKVPGPYYDGIMSHGVPIDVENPPNHGRIAPSAIARHGHEATDIPHHEAPEVEPDPVPVYIVERAGGGKGLLKTAMNSETLPVSGSDPQRIIGQDLKRVRIGLINEDSTHHARFDTDLGDLARGRGSILPAGATSYLWLETQDSIFAVSNDSSTVKISFITEYELPNGA